MLDRLIPRLFSRGPIEAFGNVCQIETPPKIPRLFSRGPIEAMAAVAVARRSDRDSAAVQPRPH